MAFSDRLPEPGEAQKTRPLGRKLATATLDERAFRRSIDRHANHDFGEVVSWLRGQPDRTSQQASPRLQRRPARLFPRTVELAVTFVEAALDPEGDGEAW